MGEGQGTQTEPVGGQSRDRSRSRGLFTLLDESASCLLTWPLAPVLISTLLLFSLPTVPPFPNNFHSFSSVISFLCFFFFSDYKHHSQLRFQSTSVCLLMHFSIHWLCTTCQSPGGANHTGCDLMTKKQGKEANQGLLVLVWKSAMWAGVQRRYI